MAYVNHACAMPMAEDDACQLHEQSWRALTTTAAFRVGGIKHLVEHQARCGTEFICGSLYFTEQKFVKGHTHEEQAAKPSDDPKVCSRGSTVCMVPKIIKSTLSLESLQHVPGLKLGRVG